MSKLKTAILCAPKIVRTLHRDIPLPGLLLSQSFTRNMSSKTLHAGYPYDFLDFVNASPSRKLYM